MLNSLINVDLHIHSFESKYKEGKIKNKQGEDINIVENSTIDNIDVILNKLNDNNINLFSFTDHNRFNLELYEKAKEIVNSNKYNNIKNILPGIEFDVKIDENKDSCHIITIFDAITHDDLLKIKKNIDETKLVGKNDFYDLDKFESLMKKIGLNTIFIACQRKSLDNPSGGVNSISNSVDDIYEFLKVGFINALEYQKSNVEGMLLDNLKDFPKQIGLVCGSDCHQWEVYPLHDETDKNINKKFYFTVKSLPTFLGLLLAFASYNTRFRRKSNTNDYYHSFMFDGKSIPLSGGINVIVGENGSGKSTLLNAIGNEKLDNYQKTIINKNNIEVDKTVINKQFVKQNAIIEKTKKSEKLFDDSLFNEVDNSTFEKTIKKYGNDLFKFIAKNINSNVSLAKFSKTKVLLNPELYYNKTYYINIDISDLKTKTDIYKEHLISINNIIDSIEVEIKSNIYNDEDIRLLKTSYNKLLLVRKNLIRSFTKLFLENEVINVIIEQVKDYQDTIKKLSTSDDDEINNYKGEIKQFVSNGIKCINDYKLTKNKLPLLDIDFSKEPFGLSENKDKGYRFIKKAKYYKNEYILDEFYKMVFNNEYRSFDKLNSIKTVPDLVSAITSANSSNYKDVFVEKVNKFISTEETYSFEVLEASSQKKMGNTLGEKSLVYYKYLTYEEENEYSILFIDQPEDNISNIRIVSDLIDYFNKLRDNKQIIFVTHNPLLVINLDVDNVIIVKNNSGKLDIKSGCLEYENNLEEIAKLLDGGKELIEKRLKLYYGRENN